MAKLKKYKVSFPAREITVDATDEYAAVSDAAFDPTFIEGIELEVEEIKE